MRHTIIAIVLILFCAHYMVPQNAQAHVKSQSFSQWTADKNILKFNFIVDNRRITQLSRIYKAEKNFPALLERHLKQSLKANQEVSCELSKITLSAPAKGHHIATGNFSCPDNILQTPTHITIESFHQVSATHIHFARLNLPEHRVDIVLHKGQTEFNFQAAQLQNQLTSFLKIGFAHVVSGLDHILFLLALMLVARTPKMALLCITGFTLGHSLTLGLVVFNWVDANMPLIEAMIGLTIALTAAHAAAQRNYRLLPPLGLAGLVLVVFLLAALFMQSYPLAAFGLFVFVWQENRLPIGLRNQIIPVTTFAFGLVHGAGFAEGLLDLEFNQNNLMTPILGFNLGVELAQITVFLGFMTLAYIVRQSVAHIKINMSQLQGLEVWLIYFLYIIGIYWFAVRLWT
ncbi:MAG: HupE/UreJ family protein [Parvibaculales bacterium]